MRFNTPLTIPTSLALVLQAIADIDTHGQSKTVEEACTLAELKTVATGYMRFLLLSAHDKLILSEKSREYWTDSFNRICDVGNGVREGYLNFLVKEQGLAQSTIMRFLIDAARSILRHLVDCANQRPGHRNEEESTQAIYDSLVRAGRKLVYEKGSRDIAPQTALQK